MVLRGVTFVTLQFQIKQYGFHLSFMGCFLPQAVLLCVQRPEYARHCNFAVLVLLVGMQSQSLRTSRNRDGCTLLRSPKKAFCKKRVAYIHRM